MYAKLNPPKKTKRIKELRIKRVKDLAAVVKNQIGGKGDSFCMNEKFPNSF